MAFAYLQLLHVPGVLVCFVWGTIIGIFTSIAGLGTFLAFITAPAWLAEVRFAPLVLVLVLVLVLAAPMAISTVPHPTPHHAAPYLTNLASPIPRQDPPIHSETEANGIKYLGYFFCGLAGLWALVICCLAKRIFLAIGITKEAAR